MRVMNIDRELGCTVCRSLSVLPTVAAYNNRAQAEIKLQNWHRALSDCQKVLELEPGNAKGKPLCKNITDCTLLKIFVVLLLLYCQCWSEDVLYNKNLY